MKTETIILVIIISFFVTLSGGILLSQYLNQNFQMECIKNGGNIEFQYGNVICVKK